MGPPDGQALIHRCQAYPHRQQGCRRQVRGHQHERKLLPQQAEVPRLLEEALQRQALPWTLPLQGSLQDLLAHCAWHDPPPYDKKKLMVIPSALKVLRLKHGRRFCSLGRLGHEVGWKYQDIVAALEVKRKVKGEAFHKGKLEVAKARAACMKDAKVAKQIAPFQKVIESYGHQ